MASCVHRALRRRTRAGDEESWDFVTFPLNAAGTPALREDLSFGKIVTVEQTPIGENVTEARSVTTDIGFGEPTWRSAGRAAVEAAIGQPMPQLSFVIAVEPATRDHAIAKRLFGDPPPNP